jgi:Clp amino terminal domain, pathogenicity island component
MFERYTERARRTLFFARYEASQLGSITIEPEHLLLGIIREGKGVARRVLARAHVSLDNLRSQIEQHVRAADKVSTSAEILFSAGAKRMLQRAALEADGLSHGEVGVEHLLLGLLEAESNGAASWLIDSGLTLQRAREEVRQLHDEAPAANADWPPGPDEFQVRTRISPFAAGQARRPDNPKPNVWPSYDVHISPASQPPGSRSTRGPDFWAVYGFTLGRLLADLYEIDEGRIELPATHADDARFDIVAVVPNLESPATMTRLVQQAIERRFGITLRLEARPN